MTLVYVYGSGECEQLGKYFWLNQPSFQLHVSYGQQSFVWTIPIESSCLTFIFILKDWEMTSHLKSKNRENQHSLIFYRHFQLDKS